MLQLGLPPKQVFGPRQLFPVSLSQPFRSSSCSRSSWVLDYYFWAGFDFLHEGFDSAGTISTVLGLADLSFSFAVDFYSASVPDVPEAYHDQLFILSNVFCCLNRVFDSKSSRAFKQQTNVEATKQAVVAKACRTITFERFSCRRHKHRRRWQVKECQPRQVAEALSQSCKNWLKCCCGHPGPPTTTNH